jgi:2-C-methyl-D-erythritol 4-phosphate cytidylyltransferase
LKRNPEVTAIVVAAGAGRRMGKRTIGKSEKVFATLGGKPQLFYSLKALEVSPEIDRVVLVVRKRALKKCHGLVKRLGFKKVEAIVAGGSRRQDSVEKGLRFVGESRFVLIHDGARPFLSRRLISRTLAACRKTGAAIAALPVTDTVTKVKGSSIDKTIPREDLWSAQTPQVFKKKIIEEAFRRWPRDVIATDDASMVKKSGRRVIVVEGDLFNFKITFPSDLALAESLLRLRRKPWE